MKKTRVLLFLSMFLAVVIVIYWNLESVSHEPSYQHQLLLIDDRINVLEKDIKETQVLLETIKSYVRRLANSYERRILPSQKSGNVTFIDYQNSNFPSVNKSDSKFRRIGRKCSGDDPVADVKVAELVASLPFDNKDGGVWKQGFDITPKLDRWTEQKPLQVFVVPHSHTDPGWIKTLMKYYEAQTKNILDTMLIKLSESESRKFIYAEIVFFSLWWGELNDGDRQKVRSLLSSGRLELVGGGWVMPDEAVTHYYGVLDQLQEGHSWLKRNLGLEVTSAWAIDPFGHSPTIAYMHKAAGLRGGVLQRVHYSLKKQLAIDKNLEFFWRQQWDDTGETDFLCHMMPFYSYDIPHTCGPNPAVCCQFDFNRMPGVSKNRCPWNIQPVAITDSNVAERAATLVDQYRRKAELFRSNALFIPLGDDFRWETPAEWDAQTSNYERLFAEINSHKDWHVHIQWATLADYFNAVTVADRNSSPLQSLAGDFFTYADRDQHYWSGYYTSRPFQKRFSRVVEAQQRTADILFSLALAECNRFEKAVGAKKCHFPTGQLMSQLTDARRNLALFQHHDGIAGTARDNVVEDYGVRLLSALQDARYVQQVAASFLLLDDKTLFLSGDQFNVLTVLDSYATHDSLPEMFVLRPDIGSPRWMSVFNSLGWRRRTVVRLLVSTPNISVINERTRKTVRSEAFLHWSSTDQASSDTFVIVFEVDIAALAIDLYRIEAVKTVGAMHSFGKVTIYNAVTSEEQQYGPFEVKKVAASNSAKELKSIGVTTSTLQADFNPEKGTLSKLSSRQWSFDVSVEFVSYGTKDVKEKSGAYLFIPDESDPHPLNQNAPPMIRVARGHIVNEVVSFLLMVEHKYLLLNVTSTDRKLEKSVGDVLGELEISNIVDIRGVQSNFELAMRVQTNLKTQNTFYTDLNGFQMTRRIRYEKLSLQGNFFPVTSAITIESSDTPAKDECLRLTLLTAQSAAATSPRSGAVEVILDRRLHQDDNRGLGQPLKDNRRTESFFRLVLERGDSFIGSSASPRLSIATHHFSMDMLYGIAVLPARAQLTSEQAARLAAYSPLGDTSFPCDVHLVSLRPVQANEDVRESAVKSTPEINTANRQLLSLHRMLTQHQCSEDNAGGQTSRTDNVITTPISVCMAEQNSTMLASLFAGSGSVFSESIFEPTLLSGRHSSLLLSPSENSLRDVLPPGHIRTFLVSFA